ncbi:hypothetical protein PSA7680_03173 [Pseudoruegeria aquimaris]|uniref:HupE / UreJ protein n=1 Tax=Pseudoruegeria aquimaris TaxID=393663 RepID=A0A1Y5TBN9_9RHOB|nr:HupE/UreJ family protein [Pseudoruegeria aquimaris]SLN60316.1 hypothetical protein PSA7680_03173 [Pseudoruegeria aquimaris]
MTPRPARLAGWIVPTLCPGAAFAHAPVPGIKGFYIGLLHPFSTPAQALLMLGVGLLAGSFALERAKAPIAAFVGLSLVGLFAGSAEWVLDPAMYGIAVIACTHAALAPGRGVPLAALVLGVGGLVIGAASIPDAGPARDRAFTMTGSLFGAGMGLLYIAGLSAIVKERFAAPVVQIGFRVLAAWTGAIALVMLALLYAQPPAP